MSPTFHRQIIKDGKLNNVLLSESSSELLKHNNTHEIARAMSLWTAGYRSAGKGSIIKNWTWRSPSKGSKIFRMETAWQHLIKAWTAMAIFQTLGTPLKRPGKWIDEALPNSARGAEYDLPMSGEEIQIRPKVVVLPTACRTETLKKIIKIAGRQASNLLPKNGNTQLHDVGWRLRDIDTFRVAIESELSIKFLPEWYRPDVTFQDIADGIVTQIINSLPEKTSTNKAGLNSIDFDYIGRKVKAEIKNAGFKNFEITLETTLVSLDMQKEDRLEIIFNIESQQIAHWPLNYDGHDWITVGDIIESAKKHQPVLT
jgi:hypothetical protein